MENYKKYSMQNSELILKKVIELKDPLSFLTDDIDSVISEPDSLEKFEVVLVGRKAIEDYKEGDFVLCERGRVHPIKHEDFKGVSVLNNALMSFCKVNK